MGCSSQKAIDIEEGKKEKEVKLDSIELGNKNEEEVNLENQELENKNEEEVKIENNELENQNEDELEVVELEKPNYDRAPKEDEEEPKEAEVKDKIGFGGEQEEEEIPEEIIIDEDDIKELNQNNNLNSLKKSNLQNNTGLTKSQKSSATNKNSKSLEKINPQAEGSPEKNKNSQKMLKGNKNTKNSKNVKKKPFIISEFQKLENESQDSKEDKNLYKIKIIINACTFSDEYMMPIWCHNGIYLKFRVEGKWRIDKLYDYTDSKGIPSNHSAGFNYGALIGRIGLEKEKVLEKEKDSKKGKKDLKKGTGLINEKEFVVLDEGAILVKEDGPLFLRQNLPKKLKIEPEGKLVVTIYDGEYMKIDEINKKIGWFENGPIDNKDKAKSEKNSNYSNQKSEKKSSNSNQKSEKSSINKKSNEIEEKDIEKNLRTHFNNLRMNPTMYYEKYISINVSLIKTKEYLGKIKKVINPLIINENDPCYNFIGEYFNLPNQKQLQNNLNKNKVILNLAKFDEDLSFFLCDQINKIVKVKCILTQKENPIDIIMQYLLDKKYRKYIFNEHSQTLIIKILKNYFNNLSLVIVAISLEQDDSKE